MSVTAQEQQERNAAYAQAAGALAAAITVAAGGTQQQAAAYGGAANAIGQAVAVAATKPTKPPASTAAMMPVAGTPQGQVGTQTPATGKSRGWMWILGGVAGVGILGIVGWRILG